MKIESELDLMGNPFTTIEDYRMSISEQVKELREVEKSHRPYITTAIREALIDAADTIESLSTKLQAANEELERWHTDHVNEKIKNPFAYTSTLICHNCDHKDEYIEELEAEVEELKAENMERPGEDCGGWIPCKDRLPDVEVSENVKSGICTDNGERFLITDTEGYVYESTFWLSTQEFEDDAIAWMPKPEPYHEP